MNPLRRSATAAAEAVSAFPARAPEPTQSEDEAQAIRREIATLKERAQEKDNEIAECKRGIAECEGVVLEKTTAYDAVSADDGPESDRRLAELSAARERLASRMRTLAKLPDSHEDYVAANNLEKDLVFAIRRADRARLEEEMEPIVVGIEESAAQIAEGLRKVNRIENQIRDLGDVVPTSSVAGNLRGRALDAIRNLAR